MKNSNFLKRFPKKILGDISEHDKIEEFVEILFSLSGLDVLVNAGINMDNLSLRMKQVNGKKSLI